MQCPKCGHDTKVIDSQREPTKVKRRRKCLKCDERFNTVEVSGDDFEAWSRNAERRMATMITKEVLKRVTEHIMDTMDPK